MVDSSHFVVDSPCFVVDSAHFVVDSALFVVDSIFAVLPIIAKNAKFVYRPTVYVQQQQDCEPIRTFYLLEQGHVTSSGLVRTCWTSVYFVTDSLEIVYKTWYF